MNYDVLEESRHAVENLENNAFANHKEDYIKIKDQSDMFNEQIDYQELRMKENNDPETFTSAQEELTKIIDNIIELNDGFNSSLIEVDDTNPIMDPTDQFQLDTAAIDEFLNNIG